MGFLALEQMTGNPGNLVMTGALSIDQELGNVDEVLVVIRDVVACFVDDRLDQFYHSKAILLYPDGVGSKTHSLHHSPKLCTVVALDVVHQFASLVRCMSRCNEDGPCS